MCTSKQVLSTPGFSLCSGLGEELLKASCTPEQSLLPDLFLLGQRGAGRSSDSVLLLTGTLHLCRDPFPCGNWGSLPPSQAFLGLYLLQGGDSPRMRHPHLQERARGMNRDSLRSQGQSEVTGSRRDWNLQSHLTLCHGYKLCQSLPLQQGLVSL